MTPAFQAFLADLAPRLGSKGLTTEAGDIAPWTTDWRGRYQGAAAALLSPASTGEVAEIVRAAVRHRVALVAQGGNSSMVGGATPPPDGSAVLLSLRRMNRVRGLDADAGLAVCEAGVILADLQAAALARGRRFPLTLGARDSATIGGLVSTNAGGTQVLRWGTMRGLVAGIEAVLPDGNVYDGLAALKKDNRGYDLTQLLIGAEGTLGVVTAATLRLAPAIAQRGVAWIGVADPNAALTLLRRLQRQTDAVESFELLPADSLAAVLAYLPHARAPLASEHRWHVLVEAVTPDPSARPPADTLGDWLAPSLADGLVEDAAIAGSETQAEAFWALRDAISDAERATGPAVQHDVSVPVKAMPRFMVEAAAACEARFPGTRASGFGHLGDGNVHFHVRAPAPPILTGAGRDAWYADEAPAITRFVHDLVVAAGGSISAEHGIGQMKLSELERLGPPARLGAMRAIKAGLDPLGLMNPGKLIAPAPVPAAGPLASGERPA